MKFLIRSFGVVFGALALVSCGPEREIKKAVEEGLIDPESVRYGDIIVFTGDEGEEQACAMVNARNRMGGYTGEQMVNLYKDKEGKWVSLGQGMEGMDCASYVEAVTAQKKTETK
jgi:hypothetical protein